jgi:hypothetical protein
MLFAQDDSCLPLFTAPVANPRKKRRATDDFACPWTLRSPLGLERLRGNLEAMGFTTKAVRANYLQENGIHGVRPFPHILIKYSSCM